MPLEAPPLPPARVAAAAARIREGVAKRIVGMEEVVELALLCVASGSHGLLVGVPGLAKTLLVSTLADLLGLTFRRIQFTPDLMPSDIVGTEMLAADGAGGRSFRFQPGPVFANLLLADEINRTPPKTQAALMEAMEEGQVTSSGRRHPLEPPFLVLATQNPVEQEGTYPLPAAQQDRFLVHIEVAYPSREEERRLVRRTAGRAPVPLEPVLTKEEVLAVIRGVRAAPVPEAVQAYAVALARATRPGDEEAAGTRAAVAWGAGPRAASALVLAARARAVLAGRAGPDPADIRAVAMPVLRHRLVMTFRAAAEAVDARAVVAMVLAAVPAPDGWTPPAPPSRRRRGLRRLLPGRGAA
jgi:MoxR-like ATPase